MRDVLVAVSTCERRGGVNYLNRTLEALDTAGASDYERIVFADGSLCSPCPWPSISTDLGYHSSRINLWAAFKEVAARKIQRLIFFEDDILVTRNAVRRMATVPIMDDSMLVTFFDRKEVLEGTPAGLYQSPARGKEGLGFWNTQGLVLPLRSCEFLAERDPFSVWRHRREAHGDRAIEEFMASSPWPQFTVHVPCLVRHIGEVSIAHPDSVFSDRHSRNYPGDDFDAMSPGQSLL